MVESNFDILLEKLDGFIRKYYKNQLLKGLILSIGIVLVYFLAITLLEYFVRFDSGVRMFLFYSFLATTGYVLVKMIFIPIFKIFSFGKLISYEQAAHIIGKHFDVVDDKILNTIQLHNLSDLSGDNELLLASISQKIDEVKSINFSLAIDFSENKKYLGYAVAPVLLLLLIAFGAPNIISSGSERLLLHNESFVPPAPFKFIVLNKDELVGVQQDDFEIELKIEGTELPKEVFIEYQNHQFKLKAQENKTHYAYTFRKIQKDIGFNFHANEVRSEDYLLKVHPNPTVLDFTVDLIYPKYIHKNNEQLKNIGDLTVPVGTQVKWDFNTKDANSVEIEFDDEMELINQTNENEFVWSKVINKNEAYAIKASNQFISNKESIQYFISAIPDRYPSIDVDGHVDSVLLTNIYFGGIIKDDYGFTELKLNYRVNSEEHSDSASDFISETVFINKNVSEQKFHHLWDLSELHLHTDEEVFYYFEVWDNDGVNGPKATRSKMKTFRLPDYQQLAEETSTKNQKIKEMLKKSIKDAADLKEELDKLKKEALNKKKLDWSDKKKIEDLVKKQKELTKNINEIKKENDKNAYKQSEFMNLSEETIQMQKEVDKLFQEILSDEMKEQFQELENLLTEMDKKKIQEALDELKFDSEQYENELERTLEIFKMMEFELKFDEVINRTKELAEKEREQSEETLDKEKDQEAKKSDQEKLNKEFSELKKEMDELEKMNKELDMTAGMEQMEEKVNDVEKEMQESSSELDQKKNKDASGSQEDAAEQLEEMAQKMEEMKAEMEADENALNVEKIQEILENLVTVSFDQEDLMKDVKETKRNDPRFLTHIQDQYKLKENSELIEDSLFEMSKKLPEVPQVLIREMASVNENIDKSIEYLLGNNISDAGYRQQLVMTSVNNIALMLDEAKDELNRQMAAQNQGDCDSPTKAGCNKPGSCSKPGHGNGKKKVSGKKPGKKPGKDGIGKMKSLQDQLSERLKKAKNGKMNSKELVQLAAKQEAIRRALQEMEHQLAKDAEKKGEGGKGDLKKIQELMEQSEKDIVHRTVNQQTINRQQEILTRLLEAEKAEKEREWDKKRESKEGRDIDELVSPPDFSKYFDAKKKEIELLKTIPPSLNKFYKNKVNDYFNGLEIN